MSPLPSGLGVGNRDHRLLDPILLQEPNVFVLKHLPLTGSQSVYRLPSLTIRSLFVWNQGPPSQSPENKYKNIWRRVGLPGYPLPSIHFQFLAIVHHLCEPLLVLRT